MTEVNKTTLNAMTDQGLADAVQAAIARVVWLA